MNRLDTDASSREVGCPVAWIHVAHAHQVSGSEKCEYFSQTFLFGKSAFKKTFYITIRAATLNLFHRNRRSAEGKFDRAGITIFFITCLGRRNKPRGPF